VTTETDRRNAQEAAHVRLLRVLGAVDETWEAVIRLDPEFADAFAGLADTATRPDGLDAKSRALISLAVSASVTTLDPDGIRAAVQQVAASGGTRAEVVETVQLVSVLGVHSMVTGLPEITAAAARREQQIRPDGDLDAEQQSIREEFRSQRGYWSDMNQMLLQVDRRWFAAYTRFSSHPWMNGVLSPKLRELIYVAIDLSPTHLFTDGVGPHIDNAFHHGASVAELIETLEVTALVGMASMRAAAPVIMETFG
jgi:alkylhydroperoxidase/carboxymuconolactone decarboxylase family protein YurZ